ncbi:restriction endonuclease subunit S [Lactococcus sp. FSL W8-0209]|uniref:restriction endonuclease subunit S n=1 Tax=Lactococcus sp. FSL W8-0209 TaxID=2921712 RepID=UPI0030F9DAC5
MSKKSPQLRFEGFTDAWEERKFSNLAEVRRGLTYKPSDVQKYGIRVLRSSNIAEDTFLIKSDDVFVNKEAVKIDKVKNGDILITSANGSSRLVGKHALIEGIENDTVHGGFMLVARAEKPEFVNAIMSSSWYSKFINIFVSGGNGAIGNLSKSDLEDQKVYVPSEIEQTKIGLFFKRLDDTIALHQRKLDLLKEQKKGYLQKMFPKTGEKVPELRFGGFYGDWEERKLGDILIERKTKSKISENIPLLAFASGQGVINRSERKTNNRDFLTKDVNSKVYLLTKYNDIVYNPSNLKYGAIDRNKYGTGVISPIYVTFETNQVPEFIELIVTSHNFKKKALQYEEGTVTKRQSVKPESLLTLNISISKSKEEQQKIGSFFQQLDNTIALHQRKLDLLKEQKKGFLQKMFV